MTSPEGLALLLCGVSIAAGAALLVIVFSSSLREETPPAGEAVGLRVVSVAASGRGIVVDAIVDHGEAFGSPGSPITLLLQQDEPGVTAPAWLRRWADDDAVLDVELFVGGGVVPPVIDLRDGERSLRLPVLFVR